jgi:quercetin 2,3-dioxygenase
MTKPQYQPILNKDIPVVALPLGSEPLGSARIIAGSLDATKGAAKTFSPVQLWDVSLPHAGSEIDLPFPAEHNCIVFVRRGSVTVLSGSPAGGDLKRTELGPQDVALMQMDGSDTLRIQVKQADSSVLVLGGKPLNEPVVAQGPFVMNTREEIQQAVSDYRMGKMGT